MANYDAFLAVLDGDARILVRQAIDKAALAEKTSKLTATKFLTPAEATLLRRFCQFAGIRAVFDGGDYILVSYYHSNHTENFFHSYKTVKIGKDELK